MELGRVLENTIVFQDLGKALRGGDIQKILEPKPLKCRKPGRRLTIEKVPTSNQSSLLWLPREIRDLIWRYACIDMKIHWWMQNGKLTGQLCRSKREHCQLRCKAWIQKPGNPPFQKMGIMGLLSAVAQCKYFRCYFDPSNIHSYSEIIDFVYELMIFDTREPDVIIFLPRLLLPKRMHLIQNLEFLWALRHLPSLKLWESVWKNLSDLEGLLELTVEL